MQYVLISSGKPFRLTQSLISVSNDETSLRVEPKPVITSDGMMSQSSLMKQNQS